MANPEGQGGSFDSRFPNTGSWRDDPEYQAKKAAERQRQQEETVTRDVIVPLYPPETVGRTRFGFTTIGTPSLPSNKPIPFRKPRRNKTQPKSK